MVCDRLMNQSWLDRTFEYLRLFIDEVECDAFFYDVSLCNPDPVRVVSFQGWGLHVRNTWMICCILNAFYLIHIHENVSKMEFWWWILLHLAILRSERNDTSQPCHFPISSACPILSRLPSAIDHLLISFWPVAKGQFRFGLEFAFARTTLRTRYRRRVNNGPRTAL